MRIQQLHYIIKIVETGSMNEAAKQLFITQPSLSNAVRDLVRHPVVAQIIRAYEPLAPKKEDREIAKDESTS